MPTIYTQKNTLQDILKTEAPNNQSREVVTVLAGQSLSLGEVIGKITKSTPTTGTAKQGNTGAGTVTAVTAGQKAKLGVYDLECKSISTGAATVPATGTPVSNTGGGTVASVTGGADVKIGTYTLDCKSVSAGAHVVPTTGTAKQGGNTGAGTVTAVTGGAGVLTGVYTLTCTFIDDDPLTSTFRVVSPSGETLPEASLGAYTNAQINFTINDGTPDFALADGFTITVTEAAHNSGVFTVMDPDGNLLPDASVGAYTNSQINFTIADGSPDFIVGDTFTITVTEAAHNSGVFTVMDPDGNLLPDATIGAYTNTQINFTVNDASPDFAVGDGFTITVAAGSGSVRALNPTSGVDGSQEAYGILIAPYDASGGAIEGVAIVRNAVIVPDDLVWPTLTPAAITNAEKAAALAQLKEKGIISLSEV